MTVRRLVFIAIIAALIPVIRFLFQRHHLYKKSSQGKVEHVTYFARHFNVFRRYRFSYRYDSGNWYAYVEKAPAGSDYSVDPNGHTYIYFIEPAKNFSEIMRLSFNWADNDWHSGRHGGGN